MSKSVVGQIVNEFDRARKVRVKQESSWSDYWCTYLTRSREPRAKHRSNVVSPHGGMTIRNLVPLVKREILAVSPAVRPVSRKIELAALQDSYGKRMEYWLDIAGFKKAVLTDALKEAFVFGFAACKVVHNVDTEEMDDDPETGEPRVKVLHDGPQIIHVPIEYAYFDPGCRSFDELERYGYAVHEFWALKSELEAEGIYKRSELAKIGSDGDASSTRAIDNAFADNRRRILNMEPEQFHAKNMALEEKGDALVHCLEFTQRGKVWTIANRSHLIQDEEELPHPFPWFALTPDPIPGELYGKSVFADAISTLKQRDFVCNAAYDSLGQVVYGMFKGIAGQYDKNSIHARAGGVVHVTNMNSFEPMPIPDVQASVWGAISHLDQEYQRATGLQAPFATIGQQGSVYNETATVGRIKQEAALLFVGEMVEQLETGGLKRMAEIVSMIEAPLWVPERWIELLGEEGGRFIDLPPDEGARAVDWKWVGSEYRASQENAQTALAAAINPLLAMKAQGAPIDLRWLARTLVESTKLPNGDKIVSGEPRDLGPDVEHVVMQQGNPVTPEAEEDLEAHHNSHTVERDRAISEGGDPAYIARLNSHLRQTERLMQIKAAMQQQMLMQQMGAGNGPQ